MTEYLAQGITKGIQEFDRKYALLCLSPQYLITDRSNAVFLLCFDGYSLLISVSVLSSPYVCAHNMSHVVRKPVFGVSDQGRHKPGCTIIGDG